MAKTTPMQRTLEVLKKDGLKYWIVEHWNQWAKRRVDLFNIIDLIVLDSCVIGMQICGSDYSSHKTKILEQEKENTISWLTAGGKLEIWGWRKKKKVRGKKATYWSPRISDVMLCDGELCWKERK